ncbi:mucin-5AC-like [Schistocerca nitens]|uniref:mucin-5AC-like n=1 Tax=Schistocerca nitens TaxID=7011 RepID=UPI002118EF5F|nr:mucin-5AC-like [Schistocerca nitens]
MGTYVALAFLLLTTALLSRNGALSQSPSLTEFAAFCNEIGNSGGAPNPFLEVLCRQVAERTATQPPPTATTPWNGAEALNASGEAPAINTDLATPLITQQDEQQAVKQANDGGVIPQETNHTSEFQSLRNETLNVSNALPGGEQSVIALNNTFPQEQVDLEVSGGSDFSWNVGVPTATTGEKNNGSLVEPQNKLLHIKPHNTTSNRSVVEPQNKLLHIEPHNVTTFYVGVGEQSELVGDGGHNGRNSTRSLQAPVTNLKTVKRGDQMPVPGNKSSDSPAVRESPTNQTFNNAETHDQFPQVERQQSLDEGGLFIQQSGIQNSSETPSMHQSPDTTHVLEKEQKDVPDDRSNGTEESISEAQLHVEQLSTSVTSETEAPITTEVATDGLYISSSGSNINRVETEGAGHGSNASVSSAQSEIQVGQVSNSTFIASDVGPETGIIKEAQSSIDAFSEVQNLNSQNIPTQEFGTTQSTNGDSATENEQSLVSEQVTSGGQSSIHQTAEGVLQDSPAKDTQPDQGEGIFTSKTEPTVDLVEATTESTVFSTESTVALTQNPAHINGEESKVQPPVILEENLGNSNSTAEQPTSGGMSSTIASNNSSSGQDPLRNNQNEANGGQKTSVTETEGNSDNRSENQTVDFSSQTLPSNSEVSDSTGSKGTKLPEGVSSSNQSAKSTPQLGLSGGSTSQFPDGVSSSEGNSVASASLPPNPAGSFSQFPVGVSPSEGNSLASRSLPSNSAGPTSQAPVGEPSSEGNSVVSASLPLNPAGPTSQSPVELSSSEGNSIASASFPSKPAGSTSQPTLGVSSSDGNAVGYTSLLPNPGSTSQPPTGLSSSEGNSVASTSLPTTPEGDFVGDSILVMKEMSTKFLEGLAEVHCRQVVNDFWKNVTEVFRRVSASHKPTVWDMTSSVREVLESYRRESPYWETIAAKLEEATSDRQWRQLLGSLAGQLRGDVASQLRLVLASRQLRAAVRAALTSPECRAAGAQPSADSCDQFVLCYRTGWQWRALKLSCPRGSAFSRSERRCVWRPLADCRPDPLIRHWFDDDGDSDSDSDSDTDSDSDSGSSEDRRWSLFRMFDFRH